MSTSLSVECDPIDQPAATDPVERRTWCALRIRIRGRTVTRIWDKALGEERSLLYVPTFPIAEWIVQNWWLILHEPCRTEQPLRPSVACSQLPWVKRHCWRSAESGLLLPALYLFNDGRGVRAEWQADEQEALPNLPGEFVDSGSASLDRLETEEALARFVSDVLGRVRGVDDARVAELDEQWRAIRGVDADEAKFCMSAGRLGVDPYDPSQMTDTLATFLESSLGNPDVPLVRDLTEVAEAETVAEQWSWVQEERNRLHLGPGTGSVPIRPPATVVSPAQRGYQLAHAVRQAAGLDRSSPVASVPDVARRAAGTALHWDEQNHLSGRGLRLVVGWSSDGHPVAAGPPRPRPESKRFHLARALHHVLFACRQGERLVTDAYTWDQQVSRAFAAELLAPRQALAARAGNRADPATIQELAREYETSVLLVERQLENAGVTLIDE